MATKPDLIKEKKYPPTCIILGAGHAGVTCAFSLRKNGWQGAILLVEKDLDLPYHRPPLSKSYLLAEAPTMTPLKALASYQKEDIQLLLGACAKGIDKINKFIILTDGRQLHFDKLVLALGSQPIIPSIKGINVHGEKKELEKPIHILKSLSDAQSIKEYLNGKNHEKVVIIGGGYIGLELSASLTSLGCYVTILERESRVLKRVTAEPLSEYFEKLHRDNGVQVETGVEIISIKTHADGWQINISDDRKIICNHICMATGVYVDKTIAQTADLDFSNGIKVDHQCETSHEDIYAIGDITCHYNPHYQRFLRLESVQNALDQARVAAAAICGSDSTYDSIPWFWSDQYKTKLQIAGISEGHDSMHVRYESSTKSNFSIWYFKSGNLLAVEAINNPRAYLLGLRLIKERKKIDISKLINSRIPLVEEEILIQ